MQSASADELQSNQNVISQQLSYLDGIAIDLKIRKRFSMSRLELCRRIWILFWLIQTFGNTTPFVLCSERERLHHHGRFTPFRNTVAHERPWVCSKGEFRLRSGLHILIGSERHWPLHHHQTGSSCISTHLHFDKNFVMDEEFPGFQDTAIHLNQQSWETLENAKMVSAARTRIAFTAKIRKR